MGSISRSGWFTIPALLRKRFGQLQKSNSLYSSKRDSLYRSFICRIRNPPLSNSWTVQFAYNLMMSGTPLIFKILNYLWVIFQTPNIPFSFISVQNAGRMKKGKAGWEGGKHAGIFVQDPNHAWFEGFPPRWKDIPKWNRKYI